MMDRLPRKPFLVWGDLLNGVCYAGAGLFLLHSSFSYIAYLAFSLLVSCLGAFDELAYNSFYPLLLPKGQEERAYTVSAMLYPILKVLMMPLAAVLYDKLGVGRLLLIQAALSVLAAFLESRIRVQESRPGSGAAAVSENMVAGCPGSSRLSAAGARPARALCVHVRYQRHGLWLFSLAHRLFPHGAGLHYRHVFLFLRCGICRAHHRREPSATATLSRRKSALAFCSVYIRPMS